MGVIPIVERNGSWADMFSALGVTVLDDWSRLDAQRLADEELRITQGQGHGQAGLMAHKAYAEYWLALIDAAVRQAQALVSL